jgi:hypothetical protein
MITDQLTGNLRAPAAAFEPRAKDEALSVNLEASLLAAGLPLTWSVDLSRQYAARITVEDCIAVDLEAFHNPLLENPLVSANPHHGLIRGLVERRSRDPDSYEMTITALAKASTIVPDTLAGTADFP